MSFIFGCVPPLTLWLKGEYLYSDYGNKDYDLVRCGLVGVRCVKDQVPLFSVLLENGVLRDKLPSSALLYYDRRPDKEYRFDELCLWNSFSNTFTVMVMEYLSGAKVTVKMKSGEVVMGSYLFTIDWAKDSITDLAEDATEHKSHHVIVLEDGQIAIQPNNRVLWHEPSFVTKRFNNEPYVVNKRIWNAEQFSKWNTEDTDRYFYQTE